MITFEIHQEAVEAATKATQQYIDTNGEHPFNCGFAWVDTFVKGNTKVGKSFINVAGFKKSYSGGFQLWNQSNNYTQDMSAKEAGCQAYVDVIKQHLPDVPVYVGSRLD